MCNLKSQLHILSVKLEIGSWCLAPVSQFYDDVVIKDEPCGLNWRTMSAYITDLLDDNGLDGEVSSALLRNESSDFVSGEDLLLQ